MEKVCSCLCRCVSPRVLYALAALLCAAMIGMALYLQHYKWQEPCPLCYLQRLVVILFGIAFFIAAVVPKFRRFHALLLTLIGVLGWVIVGRHLYIQSLPVTEVTGCISGVEEVLKNQPYFQALLSFFQGSADCWKRDEFLGVRLPVWNLLIFSAFVVLGWWQVFRKPTTKAAV